MDGMDRMEGMKNDQKKPEKTPKNQKKNQEVEIEHPFIVACVEWCAKAFKPHTLSPPPRPVRHGTRGCTQPRLIHALHTSKLDLPCFPNVRPSLDPDRTAVSHLLLYMFSSKQRARRGYPQTLRPASTGAVVYLSNRASTVPHPPSDLSVLLCLQAHR